MNASPCLLLFDIDGTLLKTSGVGICAMKTVTQRLFGQSFVWEGVEVSGHLDPLIFAELAAVNGLENPHEHHETFRDDYLAQLRQELQAAEQGVYALPGVLEVLSLFRQRQGPRSQGSMVDNPTLGLLTGNYTKAVPIKLDAVGIDPAWFRITAFGDEAPTRPDLVVLAMDKYERTFDRSIHPRRVVVIGDTPRDVAAAQAHDCVSFAVATGRYSKEELQDVGADVVVADLTDPSPLIDLINTDTV